MPNHCSNRLIASGPLPDVALLAELMGGETAFDFRKIKPMPEVLEGSAAGSGERCYPIFYGDPAAAFRFLTPPWGDGEGVSKEAQRAKAIAWAEDRYPDGKAKELADSYKAAVDATGHTSWYPWCIENWGTKWNAYSVESPPKTGLLELLSQAHAESPPTVDLTWSFETAWGPPMPIIKALVERFPTLIFTHDCIDEGMGFSGHYVWADGNFEEPVEGAEAGGDGDPCALTDWHEQFRWDDEDDEDDDSNNDSNHEEEG